MTTTWYRLGDDSRLQAPGSQAPAEHKTLFGAAVTIGPNTGLTESQEFVSHENEVGEMSIYRCYDGGMPSNFVTAALGATQRPGSNAWIWLSIKPDVNNVISGSYDDEITSLVNTMPVVPGIKYMLTSWHEPEGKVKQASLGGPELFTATQWKQQAYRVGQVVRSLGRSDVMYGPIFMSQYTIATANYGVDVLWNAPGGDLNEVIDFIGWDPYNEDTGKAVPTYGPNHIGMIGVETYFTDITVWSQQNCPGKPVAIGETGFQNNPADLTMRPNFLLALETFAKEQNYICVCYFDSGVGSGPWWLRWYQTTHMDPNSSVKDPLSIEAWSEVYARNALELP
jgi:hypothetical protein